MQLQMFKKEANNLISPKGIVVTDFHKIERSLKRVGLLLVNTMILLQVIQSTI